jgi:outer membrane protein assembly factor BamB
VWTFYWGNSRYSSSPALAYGYVYIETLTAGENSGGEYGHIYCLDAYNGTMVWDRATSNPPYPFNLGPCLYSPAVANGYLYADGGTNKSDLFCINAYTGEVAWNYTMPYYVTSSPVVAGNFVYSGCWDGNIYCFDIFSGEKMWSYQTKGGELAGAFAIVDGTTYLWASGIDYSTHPHGYTFLATVYALKPIAVQQIPELPTTPIILVPLTLSILVLVILSRKQKKL